MTKRLQLFALLIAVCALCYSQGAAGNNALFLSGGYRLNGGEYRRLREAADGQVEFLFTLHIVQLPANRDHHGWKYDCGFKLAGRGWGAKIFP